LVRVIQAPMAQPMLEVVAAALDQPGAMVDRLVSIAAVG